LPVGLILSARFVLMHCVSSAHELKNFAIRQVVSEFWNVCTRPATARGGLDLSVDQTERKVCLIERHFVLLPDNLATFQEWRRLAVAHSLSGVAVHDAKLVASMNSHGITNVLTLNDGDFKRYKKINVVNPADL
jgi:predicted nucleic acid-binding protein